MKILVLSDSHAARGFMRLCIDKLQPDHVIHLGDYFEDGAIMAEAYPYIMFHQVPGNCDRYRCPLGQPEVLCYSVADVRLYMTHGHKHHVKSGIEKLVQDAKAAGASAVLFGHTHQALCCKVQDMWVLNPGACGSYGGSVGFLELADGRITACNILRQEDMETYA